MNAISGYGNRKSRSFKKTLVTVIAAAPILFWILGMFS